MYDRKKHLVQPESDLRITPNYDPIALVWEEEVFDEMPILRDNWIELQNNYQVYWTECDIKERFTGVSLLQRLTPSFTMERKERTKQWPNNIFTSS